MSDVPEGIFETTFHADDNSPVPWVDLPLGVKMKLFGLGDPADPAAAVFVCTRLPAGSTLPRHYHESSFVDVVVQGSVKVGGKWYYPGDVRVISRGVEYGPTEPGPEGVTLLEFYPDGRGRRGIHNEEQSDEFREEVAKFGTQAIDAIEAFREKLHALRVEGTEPK